MFKKRLFLTLAAVSALFFAGCAQKPQANIRFDPFNPTPAILQKSGTVVLKEVVDKREKKKVVGEIVKGGKPITVVYSDQPLDNWLADALKRSLENEGCRVDTKIIDDERVAHIRVEIDSIQAILDKSKLTGENLTAEAKATLYISQGNSNVTKKIAFSQSKWVPPFAGEDEIREYLQETLSNLVEEIRDNIDCYRF